MSSLLSTLFARHMSGSMEEEEVLTPAQAYALWPVCNNITIHGPDSPQKAPSNIRMAAMQEHDSWYGMEKYMRATAWTILALMALTVFPGFLRRLRSSRPQQAARLVAAIPGYYCLAALCRRIGYIPSPRLTRCFTPPTLVQAIIVSTFSIAFTAWCFAVRPYYRCTREWGSPPLGVRAGMFANAMIPFIFAFGTKWNIVTILTNLSHERLQIWHQWLARLALFFSVVHTIPFIVQPLKEGGKHNLYEYFFHSGGSTYWSGVVALAILAWIVASATRVFRNFSYEFFVIQHIISVILFLGFYFLHTEDALNTWLWLWASVGVWGLSTLLRWSRAAQSSGYFLSSRAQLEVQALGSSAEGSPADQFVRISLKTTARWSPGQHVFVRFPSVSPLQAHPFTILTLPSPDPHSLSDLVVLARVHAGLTRSLYNAVLRRSSAGPVPDIEVLEKDVGLQRVRTGTSHSDKDSHISNGAIADLQTHMLRLPAALDGPYGASTSLLASYEVLLLIAGGSGITFLLPILSHLATHADDAPTSFSNKQQGGICTRDITLVWTLRSHSLLPWLAPQLRAASELLLQRGIALRVRLHLTRSERSIEADAAEVVHLVGPALRRVLSVQQGRVGVQELVRTEVERAGSGEGAAETMGVVVCAPREMAEEVSAQTARVQGGLIRRDLGALREVYLINEAFAW